MTAPADPEPRPDSATPSAEPGVVVTRDEDPREGRLGAALRALGVPVLHWPTTAILPPEDPSALEALPSTLADHDWVLFTSRRAVEAVAGVVGPVPGGLRVAVVGPKTAEAARGAGWAPEVVGEEGGEALARELVRRLGSAPVRCLFPTTPLAADTLPALLEEAGHAVTRVTVYRTGYAELDPERCREAIDRGRVGVVTFTSPSAVEGLERALPSELFGELVGAVPAVSIGPTTTEAVEARGWACTESAERSLEGVARRALELLELAGPPSTNESKGEADT